MALDVAAVTAPASVGASDLLELAVEALGAAQQAGADYADARAMTIWEERLSAKNGRPTTVSAGDDTGVAVRVLVDGAWGFAATPRLSKSALAQVARDAVANAKASAPCRDAAIRLADEPVHRDSWETPCRTRPEDVPLTDKLDLLVRVTEALKAESGVAVGEAMMLFRTETQHFLTTDGTDLPQVIRFAGCGMSATSAGPGGIQRRSYPNSWGHFIGGGYEVVEDSDLPAHTAEVAADCVALQRAPECPSGRFDVVVDPTQLVLQIHESVGHPLELDRVLGGEANYAGTSFATVDKLDSLRYGSEIVNLTADGTMPGGLATFGYDDEGVAAQRWPLVERGVLKGYLTAREYAHVVGDDRSRGCMRAEGWHNFPIIRMVNINLEPGNEPLTPDELIADTKQGLYLATNRSWSIDQRRVNFQFGCEAAWEIKNGKRGRLLRNPVYHGLTTEFWNSCDAICDERFFAPWGVFNCGKGQPGQRAEMTHGSAPARFRNVAVGTA